MFLASLLPLKCAVGVAAVQDDSVSVPERYLGLTMPHEQDTDNQPKGSTTKGRDRQAKADAQPAANVSTPPVPPYLSRLAEHVREHVDLELLLEAAAAVELPNGGQQQQGRQLLQPSQQQQPKWGDCALNPHATPLQPYRCRIAVARDEAFCFYYQVGIYCMAVKSKTWAHLWATL